MNILLQENFSNICRTCLSESDNLKPVFSIENISDMLMACTSIILTMGDGLPENICLKCFQQIIDTFSFRKLCEKSDTTLRNYVSTNQIFNSKHGVHHDSKEEEVYTESEEKIVANVENNTVLETEINFNHYCDDNIDICSDNSETEKDNKSFNLKNDISNYDHVDSCTKNRKQSEIMKQPKEPTDSCGNPDQIFPNSNTYSKLIFDCNECEKVFATRDLLRGHLTNCHVTKKSKTRKKCNDIKRKKLPPTCDICNKTFRFHSNLERHKLTHTGEKPYLCNICGKGFNQMSYLKIHVFTHTGEKPYKCQTCDKSFAAPGTLMTHMRTHTGERPHICKICGKGFPQSGYLSVHLRTHTGEKPVECPVCHRRFTQSGRLAIHMRIHSGEKPFICTQCDKSFAIKGTLKKHLRTHTGERLYVCKICGLAFGQSGTLRTHMKVHQKKEL